MALHEQWSEDRASEIISQHSGKDGPLLPVLQALQETFGCVPEAAVVMVAEALNLSRAEVLGVATGTTTPDGSVTLEPVYCLGLCATAPSAMIDGRVVGRLDEARLDAVLAAPPLAGTAGGTPAVPEGCLRVFIPGDA